jgi:hypothetical protein
LRGNIFDADPRSLIQTGRRDIGIQYSLALFITGIERFLGVISDPLVLGNHALSGLPDFVGSGGHVGHFVGLFPSSDGEIVSVFSARPHFEPLKANKNSSSENYYEASPCPSERRTLEATHALFYFIEIGFGGWLGWDRVFWLGFTDRRRAYRGIASILGSIALVCHGVISVTQKDLTNNTLCNTVSRMANVLSAEKQTAIIQEFRNLEPAE